MIPVPGRGARYSLVQPYSYQWSLGDRDLRIIVPRGTISDGASVPRVLWTITGITPDGLHRPAALVHDWFYRHRGEVMVGRRWAGCSHWESLVTHWTRDESDRLFARLLRESGVSKPRRRLMYLGVRVGGWMAWHLAGLDRSE
ncbi:MAG: DUF1353 domain-containing protein [Verrucomicrobiae bacterium]|nr:DUF1353 domain-containing protein [Verrucomicrobiae bacterium]